MILKRILIVVVKGGAGLERNSYLNSLPDVAESC